MPTNNMSWYYCFTCLKSLETERLSEDSDNSLYAHVEKIISYNHILISYKIDCLETETILTHIIILNNVHTYPDNFAFIMKLLTSKILNKNIVVKNIRQININTSYADVFLNRENISHMIIENI